MVQPKYLLLTPGPTPLAPSVYRALSEPLLHHRTDEFGEIYLKVLEDLKYVFQTKEQVYLFTCSGTGGMEAAAVNLLSPGDQVLVAPFGAFGDRWVGILKAYGLEPRVIPQEWGRAPDPEKVEKALKENPKIAAVFTQHTDTSTGVVSDLKALGSVVSKTSAVLVVDAVSGLAGEELRMDEWKLDAVVSAAQKGLQNSPGLAFLSLSPKAQALMEKAKLPRFYWDLRKAKQSLPDKETPFTPAISLVVAQAEALDLIRKEGLENMWKRCETMAFYARERLQGLGFSLFPKDPCHILTAVLFPKGMEGGRLLKKLRQERKVCFAGGQAHLKGKLFRVAHMGAIQMEDLKYGLDVLEEELKILASPS